MSWGYVPSPRSTAQWRFFHFDGIGDCLEPVVVSEVFKLIFVAEFGSGAAVTSPRADRIINTEGMPIRNIQRWYIES